MRRLPSISVRLTAALAAAAVFGAVVALAAIGTFSGSTQHAKPPAEQDVLHVQQHLQHDLAVQIVQIQAAEHAREEAAKLRAILALRLHIPHERYSRAVRIAEKYLGVPYVWGGASPHGFDDSGLVKYVYGKLGVSLPHNTVAQYWYRNAAHPPRSGLRPGDLVFFDDLGTVGIYIGRNEFIQAGHTGTVVHIDSLTGRYAREYDGATRILR